MNYTLCFQASYQNVIIALCNNEKIITNIAIPHNKSSASLVPHIQTLLKNHDLSLRDCLYLAASQGPAPFTSLRTVLATINGIHCATHIPLIGIDALKGMVTQYVSEQYSYTIALLNAFNNELYYAIASKKKCISGYGSVEKVLELIKETVRDEQALVIGSGIPLLKSVAEELELMTFEPSIQECTIDDIATLAWAAWNNDQSIRSPLMPLYLKKHAAERA